MCSGSGTLPGLSLSSDLDRPISPRDAACPVTARLGHRAASTPRGNRASPPHPTPCMATGWTAHRCRYPSDGTHGVGWTDSQRFHFWARGRDAWHLSGRRMGKALQGCAARGWEDPGRIPTCLKWPR